MASAGDLIDSYLRVVRTQIDALGISLAEALSSVPMAIRDEIRIRFEEETALPIRRVSILSGQGGPRAWFDAWDPSSGFYWRRLRSHMVDYQNWATPDVESLDDATDKVLSHLEDPRPEGPSEFRVRGLVMGYVQSGKTANFCALISKAADIGYKLVIVLSGIHNSLRRQTQLRVNRSLGVKNDPKGVPVPEPGRRWVSLTGEERYEDFRAGTIDANVLQGNEQVILVVKKNATVLRRLIEWMGKNAPPSLPVLVVDDEADQASINTRGNRAPIAEQTDLAPEDIDGGDAAAELDPSVINGLIRNLLLSFSRVSYVAYTATPFANILINHEAMDREVYEDLYPKDFIVALPRPNGYCGAERLFGRDALPGEDERTAGLDVIDRIPEHEATRLTPTGRDVVGYLPQVCASMRTAFIDFVLAVAARLQRTDRDFPASMLVHTHHRMHVQNQLGRVIRDHLSELRQCWRYDRNSIRPVFKARWEQRFRPLIASVNVQRDIGFDAIEECIDRFLREPISVLVLNSESGDELDYDRDPYLKAVIVGGNRLSRGLTLEGLLTSYYVRKTEYYDALMQMGRWFGFREGHVELTRIWTTDELAGWFRDLALAEEELRLEIARYERENLTPTDFGPRIRIHPAMMITAKNKMGSARVISQNYSGAMRQTTAFRFDDRAWLQNNLDVTARFVQGLGPCDSDSEPGQPIWRRVSSHDIDAFLSQYAVDPRNSTVETVAIREYIQAQVRQGELTDWLVSVRGRKGFNAELGVEPSLVVSGVSINRILRTRLKSFPHSIGSLINPATLGGQGSGDEEIGLSVEMVEAARLEAREAGNSRGDYPFALRSQRDKREGLLLIYPVSPYSRPQNGDVEGGRIPIFENPEVNGCTVIGMAIVFPVSKSSATIQYTVGSVGRAEEEE
jgi:hypothetical protein